VVRSGIPALGEAKYIGPCKHGFILTGIDFRRFL
jgi:hypothetical protein